MSLVTVLKTWNVKQITGLTTKFIYFFFNVFIKSSSQLQAGPNSDTFIENEELIKALANLQPVLNQSWTQATVRKWKWKAENRASSNSTSQGF